MILFVIFVLFGSLYVSAMEPDQTIVSSLQKIATRAVANYNLSTKELNAELAQEVKTLKLKKIAERLYPLQYQGNKKLRFHLPAAVTHLHFFDDQTIVFTIKNDAFATDSLIACSYNLKTKQIKYLQGFGVDDTSQVAYEKLSGTICWHGGDYYKRKRNELEIWNIHTTSSTVCTVNTKSWLYPSHIIFMANKMMLDYYDESKFFLLEKDNSGVFKLIKSYERHVEKSLFETEKTVKKYCNLYRMMSADKYRFIDYHQYVGLLDIDDKKWVYLEKKEELITRIAKIKECDINQITNLKVTHDDDKVIAFYTNKQDGTLESINAHSGDRVVYGASDLDYSFSEKFGNFLRARNGVLYLPTKTSVFPASATRLKVNPAVTLQALIESNEVVIQAVANVEALTDDQLGEVYSWSQKHKDDKRGLEKKVIKRILGNMDIVMKSKKIIFKDIKK